MTPASADPPASIPVTGAFVRISAPASSAAVENPWSARCGSAKPSADGGTADAREGVRVTFEAPYQRRLVVEGFETPRVEAADGSTVSADVSVTGYQSVDAVKVEVPKAAVGGLAELSPLVLGQDEFAPGRVRAVDAERAEYAFGGGRDDDANPNVIDLVTPEGVDQSEALAYAADERATIPYLSLER